MPRKRKNINQLCYWALSRERIEALSDKELIRMGCISDIEFRLKFANFNTHKTRIQRNLRKSYSQKQ